MKYPVHPDWQLIYDLEASNCELCNRAAVLLRELKKSLLKSRDETSRLRYPDTTGQ